MLTAQGPILCLSYFINTALSLKCRMYALPFIIAGVWAHGDFIHMNPKTNGGIVMLGRSDGTLNPNGVRFGSAEIYNIVEHFSEIADSLCVSTYI